MNVKNQITKNKNLLVNEFIFTLEEEAKHNPCVC